MEGRKAVASEILDITSVAKAIKVLRKLGCCFKLMYGFYRACVEMVVIKLFCLVKSQKLLSKLWLYSIHDVISNYSDTLSW